MSMRKTTFAVAGITALLLPASAMAAGGSLTRADFERCNQQAMQVAGVADSQSPAASPGMSGSGSSTSGSMGRDSSTSGTSSPSTSGSGAGSSTIGSGSGTSGSGSMSGGSGTTGSSGSGSMTGAGSSTAANPDLLKIDRAAQAFRDCLQQGR